MLTETRRVTANLRLMSAEPHRRPDGAITPLGGMGVCSEQANSFEVFIIGQIFESENRHARDAHAIAEFNPFRRRMVRSLLLDKGVEHFDVHHALRERMKAWVGIELSATRELVEVLPIAIGIGKDTG